MKHFNNPDDDDLEKIRMENELKKMKLILEQGAVFSETSDKNPIPPLIENEFLNSIEAFEKGFQDAKRISVYDFIHKPDFRAYEDVPDSQISAELDRIMDILNENGIQLDTICDVEEREIYRFITEELFLHEMDDMRIPGMMNCFIYEEFHPNHEYDIREHSTDGIKSFLNKKDKFYATFFTKEAEEDPGLKHFRDAFKSFSIKHFEIIEIRIEKENALVEYVIDFLGTIEGSNEKQRYKGKGSIEMVYRYDFWCIQKIHFPQLTGNKLE